MYFSLIFTQPSVLLHSVCSVIVSKIVMLEVDKKRPLMTPHAPTCLRLPDCGRGLFEPLSPSSHVFIMVVVHDDRDDDEQDDEYVGVRTEYLRNEYL